MKDFTKGPGCIRGGFFLPVLVLVFLAGYVFPVCAQQADSRIERIRRTTTQINDEVAESERVAEGTGVYCNELIVNKGDKSWPAVGIYRTVIDFYYTFGDREQDPYPNRLLKITVKTKRSDRNEYAEYIFNSAQQLIFYYEKEGENTRSERRYYFASERVIRGMEEQRVIRLKDREAVERVSMVLKEKNRLRAMFIGSLGH
jgi:hypothetical protein